nr:hypothetical protein A5881_004012 [Enterococcus termitis]
MSTLDWSFVALASGAVSYTHLDVYKRQVLFMGLSIFIPMLVMIIACLLYTSRCV